MLGLGARQLARRGVLALVLSAPAVPALAAHAPWAPATQVGPLLLSIRVDPPFPRVGEAAAVVVVLKDPKAPISGVTVDFGEPGGISGERACRLGPPERDGPFAPGTAVTIRIPFRFRIPGPHEISGLAAAGDCFGNPRTRGLRVKTIVRPISGTLPGGPLVPVPIPRSSGADCSNADLGVTDRNRPRVEAASLCLMNVERGRRGVAPLARNARLEAAARAHTRDMVRRRYFEHEGTGGPAFPERLRQRKYVGSAGEDIGYQGAGPGATARAMVRQWMDSAPHRANILRGGYRAAGIGVAAHTPTTPSKDGVTFTADFGSRR